MNLFSVIKQQLSILEVVQNYTSLKKAGHYYKGTCPFHHERTASFTVTPHKEIFYCFGCHVGGDVISFVAQIEHNSPLEAARHLVERYALKVPEQVSWEKSGNTYEAKKRYYKTCEVFAAWCQSLLAKTSEPQTYLLDRQISLESLQKFTIGYCSSSVKQLLAFAQKENILAQNFLDAHILKEHKMGLYLAFDERIIFPIKDPQGNMVGFGGRIFKPGDERAKYYNSQDHELFNKSTLLFGFDRAKKAIAQSEAAFLVEGYTDLIMMHQHGYTNTVATLGTACTSEHLQLLARYAQSLYVLYDGDAAGQKAVMRLVELCWQASIDLYVVTLPPTDDPASYLLKHTSLEEPLTKAYDIFSFVVNHLADDFTSKSLQGKLNITKRVLELIHGLQDPLKKELLLGQASEVFGIPLESLKKALRTIHTRPPQSGLHTKMGENNSLLQRTTQLEKKLFSVILNNSGALNDDDQELLGLLLDEQLKKVFNAWQAAQTEGGTDLTSLFELVSEDEKAFISHCISVVDPDTPEDHLLPAHLTQLYKRQWKKRVHEVKQHISEAEQQGDKTQVAQLLTDLTMLKNKMLQRGIA